ncbi:MAG: hypothetical protein AB7V32_02590 [Candidatus Berkiella sp.]
MPSRIKPKRKAKGILKNPSILKKRTHRMKTRSQVIKRVTFQEIDPLFLSMLESAREQLHQSNPNIVSTREDRAQQDRDRILWRQNLERKRHQEENSFSFTKVLGNIMSAIFGSSAQIGNKI